MNNYRQTNSATSMMSQLGWEELRLRRARIKTILLFKIVNNLVDIPPEPFLIPTGTITRGHSIVGRTKVVNARSLAEWGQVPMFLLKKAKVLFAFFVTASTWVFQDRLKI
jgi:hypothetical protein